MTAPLSDIDATLDLSGLEDAPRALLLLKLCQATRALRPDAFPGFLDQLQAVAFALPLAERTAYEALVSVESSASGAEARGMAAALAPELAEAVARSVLARWWWPFGRGPAWLAIANAWASIDREAALDLLPKLAAAVRTSFVQKLHGERSLTEHEWAQAREHLGERPLVGLVCELLDDGAEELTLPEPFSDLAKQASRTS